MSTQTILIVEDEPDILELLAMNFSRRGFRVLCATDGTEALQQLRCSRPSLVLTDLCLPGHDGNEIVRFLRSDQRTATVPVIMISASPSAALPQDDGGPDMFMRKPFGIRDITAAVEELLHGAA